MCAALLSFHPTACKRIIEVERPSCLACHRPLQQNGDPHGIEVAHPDVDGEPLACTRCHGGDGSSRYQSTAHPPRIGLRSRDLYSLSHTELDELPTEYLRFINPGDLRVADISCGDQSGGCHSRLVDSVKRSPMATLSGVLAAPRYRAAEQYGAAAVKAVYSVRDNDFVYGQQSGTLGLLDQINEPRVSSDETEIGPFQDLMLTKQCMGCHLWSYGDNQHTANYRSSGCSACHMVYSDQGLSATEDPTSDPSGKPRTYKHILDPAPPTEQCNRCHYGGSRLGISYQGFREAGVGEVATANHPIGTLGQGRHGKDPSGYIVDEDTTNLVDETPPDVHFSAGLHCVDCHTSVEVHGDGALHQNSDSLTRVTCESCHGTADAESDLTDTTGEPLSNLSRDDNGVVWLTRKRDGERHRVSQITELLAAETSPSSDLHRAMGRNAEGFSHLDSLTCDSCHSSWVPSCYGCHVSVDMAEVQRSQVSGQSSPGAVSLAGGPVTASDLVLIHDSDGKIAPSVPGQKLFFTAQNGDGDTVIDNAARTAPSGTVGHGQRAVHPHTVQSSSPFSRCSACHSTTDGANAATLDMVTGFGSPRFLHTDGDGKQWPLDRVQPFESGEDAVTIGRQLGAKSRPLDPDIVQRMRDVIVE